MEKTSKISVAKQIKVLKYAKTRLVHRYERFTCLAIETALHSYVDAFDLGFRDKIKVTDYIPSHNRNHASKLCKLNDLPMPNTTRDQSPEEGWWLLTNPTLSNYEYTISIRIKYLDALIKELKHK